VNKIGDLPEYGTVWFYKDGIANIALLNNVKKKYNVTYDSTACDCFEVHKANGTKGVFKPSKKGLFYSSFTLGIILHFMFLTSSNMKLHLTFQTDLT